MSLSSSPASADAVSRRAYEIWEQEGKPDGCDLRHWLQAEQEVGPAHHGNGAQAAAPFNEVGTAELSGTDTRPSHGTRAEAPSGSREPKRSSTKPAGTSTRRK